MLKDLLIKNDAVKFGEFVLPYGQKTNYFVNIKEVSTKPELLKAMARELSKEVKSSVIAGVELGAVPLLIATAIKLEIPFIIVRKKYEHGTKDLLIGSVGQGGDVDIIDDVVASGNSIVNAANLLRSRGARISRAICVVDREEGGRELLSENGIELISLVKRSEILKGR